MLISLEVSNDFGKDVGKDQLDSRNRSTAAQLFRAFGKGL